MVNEKLPEMVSNPSNQKHLLLVYDNTESILLDISIIVLMI